MKFGDYDITSGRIITLFPTKDTFEIMDGGVINVVSGGQKGAVMYADYKFMMKSVATMKEVFVSGYFKKTI